MNKKSVLFVGYGNITLAILRGFISSGLHLSYELLVCGRSLQKASDFLNKNNLEGYVRVVSAIENKITIENKIVFLCIKPSGLYSFDFMGCAESVISVMAGVQLTEIKKVANSVGYVRVMPNTAARYQKSSSVVFVDNANLEEIEVLISSFGNFIQVDREDLVDSAIATSGSSPAFVALMAQALIDAGVREGFNRLQSQKLVEGMFEGFSLLLKEKTPQEIIDEITSPGGTTIEGLSVLEKRAFKGIIMEAAHQAVIKAKKNS